MSNPEQPVPAEVDPSEGAIEDTGVDPSEGSINEGEEQSGRASEAEGEESTPPAVDPSEAPTA